MDVSATNDDDESEKTSQARRLLPLHPFIIDELRFIGFAEKLKNQGEVRLFPQLKKLSNRYGHYPSSWFGNYKRSCGIESRKKVFHSFRHNFQDNLKQRLVPTPIIDELAGHVLNGETLGRYGKEYKSHVLYEHGILKLDYGVDLSHLRTSRFVSGG